MKHELKEIINRVNSLRPAWSKVAALTYPEMRALTDGKEALESMSDDDWTLIREFFDYTPRQGERFYRVTKKANFMEDPSGTLAAAEEWAKTHRRAKPRPASAAAVFAPVNETVSPEEALKILRGDS